MNIRVYFRAGFFAAVLIALFIAEATALSIRDRIINDITFSRGGEYSIIKVSFNFPVRYLRHYPLNFGKEVRIQFEPILTSREDDVGLNKRESLFPPAKNPAGFIRVEYEGSNLLEPSILLVFDKARSFDAKQGDDFRSLMILVPVENGTTEQKQAVAGLPETAARQQTTDDEAPQGTTVGEHLQSGMFSKQGAQSLLNEGVIAMSENNYYRAIQIYTKLLDSKSSEVLEIAQFQLALAQENIGHLAHAKAEYKNYLTTFPGGRNAEEARERLTYLLSARPVRIGDPLDSLGKAESLWENEFYGGVSISYDKDESFYKDELGLEEEEVITNINSLITGIDATWRLRSDKYTLKTVATGSFENDFVEDRDNEMRSSALYVNFEDISESVCFRLGRQSSSKGGVLSRFDGARVGYSVLNKIRLNMVAGYPVERSSDGLETKKYFYGINFDIGTFYDRWDFNTYIIDQVNDGIDDRRAVGGELRYVGNRGSFFTLIDYDILFDEVGMILFAGNYLFPNNQTRLNISVDFRSSPILSTSNALIGQTSPTLEGLVNSLGEEAVRQLARDRSLNSRFITMGLSHPLTGNIQIAADVSWSKLDDALASGGVDSFESTGDEYYYSLQFIGQSLFKFGDMSTFALRHAVTKRRDTSTLIFSTRYPIIERWRINPKLQIDYRKNKEISGDQWHYRPGLRLEYTPSKSWRFEVEGEYSFANKELEGLAENREEYSISLGARCDF